MIAKVYNCNTDEMIEVKIGDSVGFKSDIEQSGVVVGIAKSYMGYKLTLANKNGFCGGYIGGKTTTIEEASDCWI
jgi:hypothetical protein